MESIRKFFRRCFGNRQEVDDNQLLITVTLEDKTASLTDNEIILNLKKDISIKEKLICDLSAKNNKLMAQNMEMEKRGGDQATCDNSAVANSSTSQMWKDYNKLQKQYKKLVKLLKERDREIEELKSKLQLPDSKT